MPNRASYWLACLCGLVLSLPTPVLADDDASVNVAELVKRLEAAEARIRQLESKLSESKSHEDDEASRESDVVSADSDARSDYVPSYAVPVKDEASDNAEVKGFADRLKELETSYKKDKDSAAKKAADALKKPTVKVGGRIHLDYWNYDQSDTGINILERGAPTLDPENRWTFRRLRMFISGDILENMLYKFEMEWANPNDTEYRDAYIGFKELPILQTVLIGNQKRPLGLDHLNSSRYNVFVERPLVIEAFNEDARRIGIASYGVSDDEVFNWRYGVYTLEKTQDDGTYLGDAGQYTINGRIAATPWYDECSGGRGYLHVALSNAWGRPDGDADDVSNRNDARFRTRPSMRTTNRWYDTGRIANAEWFNITGVEAALNFGPLQFVGEYQTNFVGRGSGDDNLFFHGAYAYVSYFITGEHEPWSRSSGTIGRVKPFENFFLVERCCGGVGGGWGAWQVAARIGYIDLSDGNINSIEGGVGESGTLGLNWWWTPYSRLQFNYVIGHLRQKNISVEDADGNDFRTVFSEGSYSGWGMRFMVDF